MSATERATVGDAMTRELHTVAPAERLDRAARVMDRRGVRQLLVLDDGRLLGLVSYRGLLRLVAAHQAGEIEAGGRVRDVMERDPVTVSPGTPLGDAIRVMLEHDVSAVPVVVDDRVVGLISEHDIVRVAGGLLEANPGAAAAP